MARTQTGLVVIALFAHASLALAEQPALREAASRGGYSSADIALIERPIAQAQADGIPVEPIVKKAHEGVSKRVPAPAIARVLGDQVQRAKTVRAALPAARRNDGVVLQAALTAAAAGADAPAIKNVGAAAGRYSEAAFYVLGVLCSAGIAPPQSGAFVRAQLEAGLQPAQMESLSIAAGRAFKAGLATASDLGSVTAADLKNGGHAAFTDRLRGVRADPRDDVPEPDRESLAERQSERSAETTTVRGGTPETKSDANSKPDPKSDDEHDDKSDDDHKD